MKSGNKDSRSGRRTPQTTAPALNGAASAPAAAPAAASTMVAGATMGQLLNTEDPAEQRQRVAQLIQVANIPSLTFLIQYDQRNGMVTISGLDSAGHTLPFEVGHKMLDLGRQALTQLEVQAKQAQAPAQGEPSRG